MAGGGGARRGSVAAVSAGADAHAVPGGGRARLFERSVGRPPRSQRAVAHVGDGTSVHSDAGGHRHRARSAGAAVAAADHRGDRQTAGVHRLGTARGPAVVAAAARRAGPQSRFRQHPQGSGRTLATGRRGGGRRAGFGHQLGSCGDRLARQFGADSAGHFYLLRDWDVMIAHIGELIPPRHAPLVKQLARDCDRVLSGFLRGQLSVMVALGTVYTVGLWLVGLDLALLIGVFAGLVSFVPYLGFILGVSFATIAVLMQYHDVFHLLLVF